MVLQDPDPTLPVLPVEVRAQDITCVVGPWAAGEGSGALLRRPQEAHIVYLGLVFCLSDWKPTPVCCRLNPVDAPAVCRHGP